MTTAGTTAVNEFVRDAILEMRAYSLEPRHATDKLDQNESPFDLPLALKEQILERVAARPWNVYPDFELVRLRTAIATAYSRKVDEILVGNGSNELLFAALTTLVAPGRDVIFPSPTFPLYEKIGAIAGGITHAVRFDPASGTLPVAAILEKVASCTRPPVVVICSPNNPTGSVLQRGELQSLLGSGAMVLLDRAYGDFAFDVIPPSTEGLVVFSTFSKAWGLAGLRIGWVTATADVIREIRKVKLPYNLNFVSEEIAVVALENATMKEARVRAIVEERERMLRRMQEIDGVRIFPTAANFIAFETSCEPSTLFERLHSSGILIRNISAYPGMARALRVSVGLPDQNDRFLNSLEESLA